MEIDKLKALLTAAETGSLSKAAELLGYTQSGLTHMMNSLEKEFGFPLLERGNRGVKLTTSAKTLAPAMRSLLEDYDHLTEAIKQVRLQNSHTLHIAAFASIAIHWLPSIILAFRQLHPQIELDFRMVDHLQSTHRLLHEEKMDLLLVSRQEEDDCVWFPLKQDQMYAVLPPTYDNGGQIVFPLADFAGMDFLVPSQGFEKDIMRIFKPVANAPHFQPTNLDDHALINLVAHDLGVTMLTELTLRSREANVQTFPVFPPAWRELGIAIRSLEDTSPEVKDFITLTQKTVQELEGS